MWRSGGWTLAYEACFYALMTVGILLAGRRGWAFAVVAVVCGAGASTFVSAPPQLWPALTPLPLEFVAGIFLARWYQKGGRLNAALAAALVAFGWLMIVAVGLQDLVDGEFSNTVRVIWYGLPATAILIGLVSLSGRIEVPRSLLWVGDVSYSLYLSHAFVLAAMVKVIGRYHLPSLISIVVLIGAALLVAGLSYRLLEVPSTRFLSRRFGVRNPQPAARETSDASLGR